MRYLTFLVLFLTGCAIVVKHPCDLTLTNMTYTGPYCPGGCHGNAHYQANTEVEIGLGENPCK